MMSSLPCGSSRDKFLELTDKATCNQFPKFDTLFLALESIDKLDETSTLYITLAIFKAVLIKLDVNNVFINVQVEDDGYTLCDSDELLTDFMSISDTQMVHINE